MSDTVTRPTLGMLEAMMEAKVGDDVFGEDPTVNKLQQHAAQLFGKEAALFCPSGTMTNQIGIKCHTQPLDEIICDENSHVYQYETGGFAFNSGVSIALIQGKNGKISSSQITKKIKPKHDWLPISKLVVIENSCNKGGGSYYTLPELIPIRKVCQQHGLKLHLDGARIFNVLVETKESPAEVGLLFDTISVCLSKGLGAPVGSLLIGNQELIQQARRFRKVLGGGMRQAGYLAAAGLYALNYHIDRLKIDNRRARYIGKTLESCPLVSQVLPVHTNIIVFDTINSWPAERLLKYLEEHHIKAVALGPHTIRMVTHLDIDHEMIEKTIDVINQLSHQT